MTLLMRRHALPALLCLVALASAACGPAADPGASPSATTSAALPSGAVEPDASASSPEPTSSPSSLEPSPTPPTSAPPAMPAPATAPSGDPTSPTPPPPAIERIEWADNLEGGRSLQVFPTAWGRDPRAAEQGWAEVVALEPEADTQVMELQFRCHVIGAPEKESWNLEPWRPAVPFHEVLLTRCNPA